MEVANVPCGECHLCCVRAAVLLLPDEGDDPTLYETEEIERGGHTVQMLKHKPNGECIYLDANGCSIHDHAPKMCRVYDCRQQYLMYSRETRRDMIRRGLLDPQTMKRGQRLIRIAKAAQLVPFPSPHRG